MATGPPRPPVRRPGPPGRQGTPGRGAPPRTGAPRPAAPRKAERIRYSAAELEETHWGRWALGVVVAAALVFGAIGWHRYLTRPPVGVPLTTAPAPPEARAPAATAAPSSPGPSAPSPPTAGVTVPATGEPVTLTAQGLQDELRSDPSLGPAQAFDQRYKNREVTWSGTVTAISPTVDRLLHFEFKDSGGVRVVAWCPSDAALAAGAAVTVRGRLASRLSDGFVVDRCEVL